MLLGTRSQRAASGRFGGAAPALTGIGPSGGKPRFFEDGVSVLPGETKSGLSASPISLWPTSRSMVTHGLPLYDSFTEKGRITYCGGTPLGCVCLSSTNAPVKASHPVARAGECCSGKVVYGRGSRDVEVGRSA